MKGLILFLLLTLFSNSLLGKLQDHFKTIEGKFPKSTIRNIDFIYMINLDERPEKFKKSMDALALYGIVPYRFSAVNGWKLNLSVINDIGVKYDSDMKKEFKGIVYREKNGKEVITYEKMTEIGTTYFGQGMFRGTIGIVLSHLSILQHAYDSGYETIWVMEDDIEVLSNPIELSDLIEKLDKLAPNWDILFTDPNLRKDKDNYVPSRAIEPRPNYTVPDADSFHICWILSKDFTQIKSRFGAHSFIIRRSGIKKILDFYKKHQVFHPIDFDMFYAPGIKVFVTTRDIVAARLDALSDNLNPGHLTKK